MTAPAIGVVRYVLLFALLYYVLMTIVGLVFIAGGVHPSGMNILVLIVVSTCVALLFIRKHRRLFSLGSMIWTNQLRLSATQPASLNLIRW
jgi:hypothetical protein